MFVLESDANNSDFEKLCAKSKWLDNGYKILGAWTIFEIPGTRVLFSGSGLPGYPLRALILETTKHGIIFEEKYNF